MALTRKFLKGMGLTEEQIDSIIDAHTETTEGLKAQIEEYKGRSGDSAKLQKQIEELQEELESNKKDSWKVKYDAIKEELETYKTEQKAKETREAKEKAYTELLKEAGVSEKRIAAILKVTDLDSIDLDDDGKVKDSKTILENIKTEWADFIQVAQTKGATTPTPPTGADGKTQPGTMTKDEIMAIKDGTMRRQKIAENLSLFQSAKGVNNNGGN